MKALASALNQGVQIGQATPLERFAAQALFRSALTSEPAKPDSRDDREFYVAVQGSTVVGAIAVVAGRFPWGIGVMVHSLAVEPNARLEGLGTALFAFVSQLRTDVSFIWGGCSESSIGFYRRLGFTVGAPGEHIFMPDGTELINPNRDYPNYFYQRRR